jgi:HK97 family phage major capsid protein
VADIDASGLVPTTIATDFLAAATLQSAALQLGTRLPMPSSRQSIPVPSAYPVAAFVNAASPHRKPYTNVQWSAQTIVAEEVAAVFSISQAFLDDAVVDIWGLVRPMATTAMAIAIDQAILFGDGAPASFPVGGVVGNLAGIVPQDATHDLAQATSDAMAMVEATGLMPTGDAATPAVRSGLRSMRTTTGEPLYMPSLQVGTLGTLWGLPIAFTPAWSDNTVDLITGDWTKLVIGVRSDMRFEFSRDGVIADDTGKVIVSAFQDDSVLARIYMRLGAVIGKPVTPLGPSQPFAGVGPGTYSALAAQADAATGPSTKATATK